MNGKTVPKEPDRKPAHRGQGGIYERGGVWYATWKFRGKRYRWSSRSERKGDATALLDQKRRELLNGTYRDGGTRITLRTLRDAMLADVKANGRKYGPRVTQCFSHLERLIGAKTHADRIADRLPNYVATRLAEVVTPAEVDDAGKVLRPAKTTARGTVNRELAALKRAFRILLEQNRIAAAPTIKLLAEQNTRTRFPSDEEIEQVIAKLPERLQGPVRFIALTGWRAREAFDLRWCRVNEKTATIRLEAADTKGRETRILPYGPDPRMAALIAERRRLTDEWQREQGQIVEYVFWYAGTGPDGQPAALPNHVYARAWESACDRAKVADLHLHDLRRAFARRAIRAGVDEMTIMRLTGWRTRSVFDRYSVRDTQDLEEGVAKLAQAAQERPAAPRTREA